MTNLLITCTVPKQMVKEVCVFQIGEGVPHSGQWVIRCFDFGQLGDCIVSEKPTEQKLKEFFENEKLIVRFEYDLISTKAFELIKPRLEQWAKNIKLW